MDTLLGWIAYLQIKLTKAKNVIIYNISILKIVHIINKSIETESFVL